MRQAGQDTVSAGAAAEAAGASLTSLALLAVDGMEALGATTLISSVTWQGQEEGEESGAGGDESGAVGLNVSERPRQGEATQSHTQRAPGLRSKRRQRPLCLGHYRLVVHARKRDLFRRGRARDDGLRRFDF